MAQAMSEAPGLMAGPSAWLDELPRETLQAMLDAGREALE
jgi:hypothetical protein